MTVKEAVSVLKSANEINLIWDGMVIELEPSNELMMDAYGDYKVASLQGSMNGKDDFIAQHYEIQIAARPEKETEHE